MATIRQRILNHLNAHPASRFTNVDIAAVLNIPTPSVRRMTLDMMSKGEIEDRGTNHAGRGYTYGSITHHTVPVSPAPEAQQVVSQ